MAATKGTYDPIKAVEGMFNGSVTRIAYALKDPSGYGASTKTVLAECAKRFHDALDDCEIQLLDAKWYLEHQLKNNRLRREAKAREMGTAAKRKHDEIKDAEEVNNSEQTAAKKAKIEQKTEPQEPTEQPKPQVAVPKPTQSNEVTTIEEQVPSKFTQGVSPSPPRQQQQSQKIEKGEQPKDNLPTKPIPKPITIPQATEVSKAPTKDQAPQEDFPKPTPQATPTGTNDDFNFESMFGDPTADIMGDSTRDDNDLGFDFVNDDTFGMGDGTDNQDPTSLDTLLPGLESYANQTDDVGLMSSNNASSNNNTNLNKNNTNNNNNNIANIQDTNALPTFSNDFDLPDLNGPNDFDALLNDESLNGLAAGNFEDSIDLNDSGLLDINFDDFN